MRLLPVLVFLVACGGSDDNAEPLISSSLTATFDGTDFMPTNGLAALKGDYAYIVVGDGNLHCGSQDSNSPPTGRGAIFQIDTFDVGVHSSLLTQMYGNNGGYHSSGTNSGSVSISASSETSVAAEVSFSYTSDSYGLMNISGNFEVVRCP